MIFIIAGNVVGALILLIVSFVKIKHNQDLDKEYKFYRFYFFIPLLCAIFLLSSTAFLGNNKISAVGGSGAYAVLYSNMDLTSAGNWLVVFLFIETAGMFTVPVAIAAAEHIK